jgi:hypothetical protein
MGIVPVDAGLLFKLVESKVMGTNQPSLPSKLRILESTVSPYLGHAYTVSQGALESPLDFGRFFSRQELGRSVKHSSSF